MIDEKISKALDVYGERNVVVIERVEGYLIDTKGKKVWFEIGFDKDGGIIEAQFSENKNDFEDQVLDLKLKLQKAEQTIRDLEEESGRLKGQIDLIDAELRATLNRCAKKE